MAVKDPNTDPTTGPNMGPNWAARVVFLFFGIGSIFYFGSFELNVFNGALILAFVYFALFRFGR